jgi:hypothetical protein
MPRMADTSSSGTTASSRTGDSISETAAYLTAPSSLARTCSIEARAETDAAMTTFTVAEKIGEGTTIKANLFYNRDDLLGTISLPETVTAIGPWAFWGCKGQSSSRYPSFTKFGSPDC